MRKIALLFVIMVQSCFVLMAQGVVCDTFHYATNGGEELYMDRYMLDKAPDASRPCLIFAFGGGFVKVSEDYGFTWSDSIRLPIGNISVWFL